ncbi:MAG: O-antigen ligase family protein [Kiritimatiellae bacterium]|nr:O-antigen ligase family protein [Kiritimatiellia bacterium]
MEAGIPSSRRMAARPSSRAISIYEWIALILIFTSFALGSFLFGAVRVWSIAPLAALVALGGAMVFARGLVFRSDVAWSVPPGWWAWMPFYVYAALIIPRAAIPYEAQVAWLMMASGPIAYLAYANLAGRFGRWKVLMLLMLLGVISIGSYAVFQHLQGSETVLFGVENPYGPRKGGTYVCPNHMANLMAMGATLGLALILAPEIHLGLKIISAYAMVIAVSGIYVSQSRSGMIGLAVGWCAVVVLTAWRRGRRVVALALLIIGPVAAVGGGWLLMKYSPAWEERISAAIQGKEARPQLWRDSIKMIRNAPLLGNGGGSYRWIEQRYHDYNPGQWAQYAHNEYLHIPVEYGLIGLALLAIPALAATGRFLSRTVVARRARDGMLAVGVVSVGAATAAHAVFDFNWHIYSLGHFALAVLGLCAAVLHADGEFPNRLPRGWRGRVIGGVGVLACLAIAVRLTMVFAAHIILRSADDAADEHAYDRAEQLYLRAAAWDPAHWHPLYGLGRVNKNRAAYAEPASEEQRAAWRKEAERYYLAADARNPYEPGIPHGLSEIYETTGRSEAALECLQRMVLYNPRRPFFFTRLGVQLHRMKRTDEAIAAFQEGLRLDRTDSTARLYLRSIQQQFTRSADAARAEKRWDEAEALYQRALELSPRDPTIRRTLRVLEKERAAAAKLTPPAGETPAP